MTTTNYTKIVTERRKTLFNGYVKFLVLPITVFNLWVLVSWLTLDRKLIQSQMDTFLGHITSNTLLIVILCFYIIAFTVWQSVRQKRFNQEPKINFNEEAELFLRHRKEKSATNEIIQTLKSKKIPSHYFKK